MTITIQNLAEKWDEIKNVISPETQKMATDNGFLEACQEWEDLKDVFDDETKDLLNKFIARVNKEVEDNQPKPEPKPKEQSKFKVGEKVLYKGKTFEVSECNGNLYNLVNNDNPYLPVTAMSVNESELVAKIEKPKKQPEPKFKVGDRVILLRNNKIYEIVKLHEYSVTILPEDSAMKQIRERVGFDAIIPVENSNKEPKPKFKTGDWVKTQSGYKGIVIGIEKTTAEGYKYKVQGEDNDVDTFSENSLIKTTAPKAKEQPKTKQPKVQAKYKKGQWFQKGERYAHISKVTIKNGQVFYAGENYNLHLYQTGKFADVEESKADIFLQDAIFLDKKPKAIPDGTPVNKITPAIEIMKRFVALVEGKDIVSLNGTGRKKSGREIAGNILRSLQKMIVNKQIRKTDDFAKDIMNIQDALVKIVNSGKCDFSKEYFETIKTYSKLEHQEPVVQISRSFISIVGKENKKTEAEKLLNRLNNANIANNKELAETMKKALQQYLDNYTPTVQASSQQLQGLYGIAEGAGVEKPKTRKGRVMNSMEFMGTHFTTMPLGGKWAKLIGKPALPFRIMFYGKPGNGKSTLALQFAGHLSRDKGKRVLYVASEEGFGYTFQEKIDRLGVANANLSIVDRMPSDLTDFDIIFIDSVNFAGFEPEQLRDLPEKKSFVFVFQSTKDGQYRGSQEFLHDVDVCIRVENMQAIPEKNRFGGTETIDVLD